MRLWRRWSRWQTEQPLVLFLAVGLFLFAVDSFRSLPEEPGEAIFVDRELVRSLLEKRGVEEIDGLSLDELRSGLGSWLVEEVLVREARRMGLDRGDVIVRRRLAQKMRTLLADLESFLRSRRDEYRHPARIGFEQVFLSRAKHGEALEAEALRLLDVLRATPAQFRTLGDPFVTGPALELTSETDLERHFGKRFTEALAGLPSDEWAGPVPSSFGLHLVRVTNRVAARPMTLDDARSRLRRDHRSFERSRREREAIDSLIARYRIVIGGEGS